MFLLFSLLGGLAPSKSVNASEALKQRFSTEAPTAWENLAEQCSQIEARARYVSTSENRQGDERQATRNWLYKQNGDWYLVESIYGEGYQNFTPGKALVFAGNSHYGFKLRKENADDDWLIQTANQEYLEGGAPRMAAEGTTNATCQRAWTLAPGIPLPNLLKAPGFQILDISMAGNNPEGGELVKLSFDFNPKAGDKIPGVPMPPAQQAKPLPRIIGSVTLDPKSYWALVAYDYEIPDGIRMISEIRYAKISTPGVAEVPVPRQETVRWKRPSGGSGTILTEITEWKFREIPEEEFTLSAYGLPEIPASPWGPKPISRRNQIILLLAVNAVLFAVIAIWMARKRRQKNQQESGPPATGPGDSP